MCVRTRECPCALPSIYPPVLPPNLEFVIPQLPSACYFLQFCACVPFFPFVLSFQWSGAVAFNIYVGRCVCLVLLYDSTVG